jgi:AcrR family transcriptional regulator
MAAMKLRKTWRRRAEARPDEILDAALDVFIANGFDAARMDDVAARAGVTKGALYLYFEGKEAMLRALIEREVQPMVARLEALAEARSPDPTELIRQAAQIVSRALANPRLFAVPLLIVGISGRFPDIAEYYRETVFARGRAVMARLVQRGVELGQFRNVDPVAAARAMMGPIMVEVIWTHALRGESELGRGQAWIDAQVDILLRGIGAFSGEVEAGSPSENASNQGSGAEGGG